MSAATEGRAVAVVVMGRGTAESYRPGRGEVCISITTPGDPTANLSPEFDNVLRLRFADVPWADRPDLLAAHGATDADVRQIVDFVRQHGDARRIVVHCTVGASRSVAVGRAIGRALGAPVLRRTQGREAPITSDRIVNRPLYAKVARALEALAPDEVTR